MSRLEPDQYRAQLEVESARLAATPPDDLTRPVPHLPGWTVHSVVGHVAWIERWVTQCLAADSDKPPSRAGVGEPPVGPDVLTWYAEAAAGLRAALDHLDLDAIHPTWTGPRPGRWWLRRVCHEVAMHRWDAQAAGHEPAPFDAALALDGVDELLEVYVPTRLRYEALGATGQTIHLHATDIDGGEWLLHLGPDALTWEVGHAKGDVAARGTASDLLLFLWGRIGTDRLEVFGDADLLARWQTAAVF